MVSFLKVVLLATTVGVSQLPVQVQWQASSQNVTLQTDVTGINHSINATSLSSPGLKYTTSTKTPLIGYTQGQYFTMTVDMPNQQSATLDLGPGPVVLNGTCLNVCLIIYYQSSGKTAQWSVH